MKVSFAKLQEDSIIPTFANDDISNAGLDLYSRQTGMIGAHESVIFDLGIAWDATGLDTDQYKPVMVVKGRSGLSMKHGIECCNAGVIDAGYRGSIKVKLYNASNTPYCVLSGERIAQGLIFVMPRIEVEEASVLSGSLRGENGFGSSGK